MRIEDLATSPLPSESIGTGTGGKQILREVTGSLGGSGDFIQVRRTPNLAETFVISKKEGLFFGVAAQNDRTAEREAELVLIEWRGARRARSHVRIALVARE